MLSTIRKIIRHLLVGKLHAFFSRVFLLSKLVQAYLHDAKQYTKHSSTFVSCSRTKDMLEARIMAHSHVIEKGLSLKDIKLNFGWDVIQNLFLLLETYQRKYKQFCLNSLAYKVGEGVLAKYIEFHQGQNQDVRELAFKLKRLSCNSLLKPGGIKELNRDDILRAIKGDFLEFIKSRHSLRNFTNEPVDLERIKKAVEIAQYSPSACNRQSARVHIVCDPQLMKTVLRYQNGNAGFGHLASRLLVVTSNINAFEGVQERNLAFVDGGIYAMNLLYGLHFEGIGACCLGWLSDPKVDQLLGKILSLNAAERIIVVIAVGQMPEHFSVAESKRKSWENICTII
jgi:nitroreductase